ncbi:MAG: DNA primase [Legionellaceae bacterium]|nr:DNA primase [Legionellaceae bacterium]
MGGLIPQPFIDELLAKIDIITFIDSYVPLKKLGLTHAACCPFHDEKTPSFNVIAKKQFYHCFGCGASGNVISFAMNYLHQDFPEAIETLAARAGLEVPHDGKSTHAPKTQTLPLYDLLEQVAVFYQNQLASTSGQTATNYLKARDVHGDVLKQYQLGYAPEAWRTLEQAFKAHKEALITTGMLIQKDDTTSNTYDRYRHRLMFPIHDRHGRIIGFGGRAIDADQKPKYLNSPETVIFQKNRELYGLHQIINKSSTSTPIDSILVVEGYMDVIALAQHGIPKAVATLGTATSTYHIQLLSKHTPTIIFCFDGDAAGKKAALRALDSTLPSLDGKLNAQFIFLPDGHDPDSLVRQEGKPAFEARLKQALPLHTYLLNTLSQSLDMSSLAGRGQLLTALKPYWKKIPDGSYKHLLLDELARITHLDYQRVENLLISDQGPVELTPKPQPPITNNKKRTPIRLATALLLQHPEIYASAEENIPPADQFTEANQRVLRRLLEQLHARPESSTAHLLELFRETPIFEALNQLAAWEHHVPADNLAAEFTETINFLVKQSELRDIEALIEKARHATLSEPERQALQAMLQNRHRTPQK